MQKFTSAILLSAGMLVISSSSAAADELRLSIANGRVTLIAHDVPVRQILDEWARIGQTKIVNGDKVAGPPVTLELTDVPEGKAIDTVLRSVSGYVLAARANGSGPSVYDRIMIMPTSRPPAVPTPPPAAFRPPVPQPMPAMPMVDDTEEMAEPEGVLPPGMVPPGNMPGAAPQGTMEPGAVPFPGQGQPAPAPDQPGNPGTAPITAPRPGQLPTAPPVPGNPYQPPPPQPVRPPGGGPGGQ
jgi:hypothetical protein